MTPAQRKALMTMAGGNDRVGVDMFPVGTVAGGSRLRMLRSLRRVGFCESLWMDELYWRITKEGRAALEKHAP